jgi:hypothetical protein
MRCFAPVESATGERELFWGMRAILWAGGGFVFLAGVQLFGLADRTDELFAWTIEPPATAAFLGACYWAAAVLAFASALQPTWARARIGVAGVLVFIWLTLLATLIHLDKFHLDEGDTRARIAGWTWLVIYLLEPPALLAAYVLQLRMPGADPARDRPLPGALRAVLIGLAGGFTAFGVALYVAPLDVGDLWPWALTPLTGRATAAWIVALGLLLASMAWEDDRVRLVTGWALLATLVPLAVAAPLRFDAGIEWGSPEMVVYLALGGVLLSTAVCGLFIAART